MSNKHKPAWVPLKRATHTIDRTTEADIRKSMEITGATEAQTRAAIQDEFGCEYWVNDLYQVQKRPMHDEDGVIVAYLLNIRRRDGRPIFRDWRHFQQIKNELVGPENEGVELYPAESRLNDTSNKYHIWVMASPKFRFPFGMTYRDVQDADPNEERPGFKQRKFA